MKFKFIKYVLIFCIVFSNIGNSYAQVDSVDIVLEEILDEIQFLDTLDQKIKEIVEDKQRKKESYLKDSNAGKTDIVLKDFDSEKWKKYNADRDYIEEEKKEDNPSDFDFPRIEGLGFIGTLIKLLVILVLVLGISFLIFKLIEAQYRKDAIVSNEKKFFIEKLEEQIHDVDLYKLLREYTAKSDYRMMVRINYLIAIKELSNQNLIDWQIQKTNGTYLQEMYSHKLFAPFQELTVLFERVWFGEVAIDSRIYKEIEPLFKTTIEDIKKNNIGNK